jgi:hypothetical protein
MTVFHLAVGMTFTSSRPATDEEFEGFLDEVVDQLERIGRHAILAARITDRIADFAIGAEADDFAIATSGFLVDIRTALHAAGCSTAGWPKFTATEHIVRELEDADDAISV